MNTNILVVIVSAIFAGILITALAKALRDAFLVPEGYAGLLYHKAKQEGQAALERARGESALLRNLANAARVLEGNPALMNLRLMQSLSAAQNAGNTLVLGMPGGFVPLKNVKPTPVSEPPAES
jgi:hypothetical protein